MIRPSDPKRTVAEGYDRIGDSFQEQTKKWPSTGAISRYTAELIQRMPSGAALLDLGCGIGVPTTRTLAGHFAVTGVDISAKQIARARGNVPNANFIQNDMTTLSFEFGTFDVTTAFFSIIHVPRDEHSKLFRDIGTWLRPEGQFVAALGARSLDVGFERDWFGTPMFWSHFDGQTNCRLVEEAGMQITSKEEVVVEEDGVPTTWLWIVATKQ